jgi:hypothetical protein
MAATALLGTRPHFREMRSGAVPTGAVNGSAARVSGNRQRRSSSGTGSAIPTTDIVEEWGRQSFPASDPPANW